MGAATHGNGRTTLRQEAVVIGIAVCALVFTMFILQGQTNSRIDSTRIALEAKIEQIDRRLDDALRPPTLSHLSPLPALDSTEQ